MIALPPLENNCAEKLRGNDFSRLTTLKTLSQTFLKGEKTFIPFKKNCLKIHTHTHYYKYKEIKKIKIRAKYIKRLLFGVFGDTPFKRKIMKKTVNHPPSPPSPPYSRKIDKKIFFLGFSYPRTKNIY